jgi:hypothetical protein
MNKITMQKMLLSLNISENTWVSNKDIFAINLANNGNFHNDFYSIRLNFNTTNEILRVKNYRFKLVSGEFDKVEQLTSNSLKIVSDITSQFAKYTKLNERLLRVRNPKIGDIVYTVNSSNSIVAITTITEITYNSITLANNISIGTNRVCYADGSLLNIVSGGLQAKLSSAFIEEHPDLTTLLYREPLTTNITDEYIDFDKINGFSLNRYKV